jgi:hypothetical protein
LVDVDEESIEEGSHVADVELRLCSECESVVADQLLTFRGEPPAAGRADTELRLETWKRTPAGRSHFAQVTRRSVEAAFRAGADWIVDASLRDSKPPVTE